MKTYARISNGLVEEVITPLVLENGQEMPIEDRFCAEFVAMLVLIKPGENVLPGDFYDGTHFTRAPVTPPSLEASKADLTLLATSMRWSIETGGIVLPSGMRVATDKADQDRITSVIVNAENAGIDSFDFKAASGWASLTLAELRSVAAAVALHVQACFSAERQHHEAIAALPTLAAAQAYDLSAHWPQQPAAQPEA